MESYVYLGSVQPSEDQYLSDIKRHIALASSVMAFLLRIWHDQHLLPAVRIRTYRALVLSTILCMAEVSAVCCVESPFSHGSCRQASHLHVQSHCQDAMHCPSPSSSMLPG